MNMPDKKAIPDGYMENHRGSLVPMEMIKEIDLLRDEVVRFIAKKADAQSEQLATFKRECMGDVEAFIALSAEKYRVKYGGAKGNVTLYSFDGTIKVVRAIADRLAFDERLQAAKTLIDECLKDWTTGSRVEIKTLIEMAFSVDKQGKINTDRILGLRRLKIKDEKWDRAMSAISDSVMVVNSTAYLRVYRRIDNGEYRQVNLDLAAL
jgi:hypothetical protein